MRMIPGVGKAVKSEINITPYIDILLVLLIIFMVVTPVRKMDLKVRAPIPTEKPPFISHSDAIVVTVGEDARIAINQSPTDISALGTRLREIYSARRNKNMFISGDPGLPYSDIVTVIDISKGAGVGEIGLLSQEIQ